MSKIRGSRKKKIISIDNSSCSGGCGPHDSSASTYASLVEEMPRRLQHEEGNPRGGRPRQNPPLSYPASTDPYSLD
ncbi:hypothetical protein GE061_002205 [Apolygus lucorum]|uniref:Uncharacterized protein n=1 Tax=Apolygus lucorum TaxID=248454 RepID=A0A8S9X424_APOLU|nr:hypothetical protein GE061_002205 [Apolygus lucorum]